MHPGQCGSAHHGALLLLVVVANVDVIVIMMDGDLCDASGVVAVVMMLVDQASGHGHGRDRFGGVGGG